MKQFVTIRGGEKWKERREKAKRIEIGCIYLGLAGQRIDVLDMRHLVTPPARSSSSQSESILLPRDPAVCTASSAEIFGCVLDMVIGE